MIRRSTVQVGVAAGGQQVRFNSMGLLARIKHVIVHGKKSPAASYVSRSNVQPDEVGLKYNQAPDAEWRRVQFLAFFCGCSTLGTYCLSLLYPEYARSFKDDPKCRLP